MQSITTIKLEPLLHSNYFYMKDNILITQTARTKMTHFNAIKGVIFYDKQKLKRIYEEVKISSAKISIDYETKKLYFTFCFTNVQEIDFIMFDDMSDCYPEVLRGDFIPQITTETYNFDSLKVCIKNGIYFDCYENDNKISYLDCMSKLNTKGITQSDIKKITPYLTETTYGFNNYVQLKETYKISFSECHLWDNIFIVVKKQLNENIEYFLVEKNVTKTYIHKNLTLVLHNDTIKSLTVDGKKVKSKDVIPTLRQMLGIIKLDELDEKVKPMVDEKIQPIENSNQIILNLQLDSIDLVFTKVQSLVLSNSVKLNIKLEWEDYKLGITTDSIELYNDGVKSADFTKDIKQANKNTIGLKNFSIINLIKYLKSNK